MLIELAPAHGAEARRLLEAHAKEMAARYDVGSWAGVDGRKDLLWLARDQAGLAVGCVALRALARDLVEVKHLYVTPAARRLGVASALMDAFEAEAARRKAAIVLETGTEQPEAVALYRKRGYLPRAAYDGVDVCAECSLYFEFTPTTGPGPLSRRPPG
jgi:ribosomal protein S18 acetylase RimI-like enzyme